MLCEPLGREELEFKINIEKKNLYPPGKMIWISLSYSNQIFSRAMIRHFYVGVPLREV